MITHHGQNAFKFLFVHRTDFDQPPPIIGNCYTVIKLTSCISEFNTATERTEIFETRLLKLIFSVLSVAKRLSQEV